MNSEKVFPTPDEAGWYFFKKKSSSKNFSVIFVNDDGIAKGMDDEGDTFILEDLIGYWEKTDPEYL